MLLSNKIWRLRFRTQNAIFSSIEGKPFFKCRLIKKSRPTRYWFHRSFFGLAFAVLSLFSANAASATPLQLQSNGYQFYTDEWVKFYLDYSQVGFTPHGSIFSVITTTHERATMCRSGLTVF